MIDMPFFSVIVPTHKRALLLRRALTSIRSQTESPSGEIIVISDVIDPATDAVCAELLTDEDIYVRRNGIAGPSASRNLGLSLARGRYVLFLDDDDTWYSDCMMQIHRHSLINESASVYFNCSAVTERRLPQEVEQVSDAFLNFAGALTDDVYVKNQIPICCFAFPKSLLQGIQFDPFMRAYEDWDFVLSVYEREKPRHVPILGARVHGVRDETSDRRGNSQKATDFNAVMDYLYVYRRHPSPSQDLSQKRADLMGLFGMRINPEMF